MRVRIIIVIVITSFPLYLSAQRLPNQDTRGWNILFEDDMSVFNSNLWDK